jgi:DNA-binding beta-propeller fold protein YncE
LRVSTHLRPTTFGVFAAIVLGSATLFMAAINRLSLPLTERDLLVRYPLLDAAAALLVLVVSAIAAWRTAQATATVRRGIEQVALGQGMAALKSGPARAPLIGPTLLRSYGLRSAIIFVVMIVALGAGTFMLREAATGPVIGGHKGFAGDYGPPLMAWLDTPGGLAISPGGDVYFADSNNDVIRRVDAREIVTVVGNHDLGTGFSGDGGPATKAQLDTPDGVAIAPDGDLIVADSHNDRIRRVDKPTWIITTIAGSGAESGYDGDDKPATQAALNTPSAVAAAPNGDIYIADTLNNRIRMIDHATGDIHAVAGDGETAENGPIGDGGPATSAKLFMPSDIALAPNGDLYIADMHHYRVRKVDRKTGVITTVAGSGTWGNTGNDGPATEASLTGPAGIAVVQEAPGRLTLFIADYYSHQVRAVGPDGIIRAVSDAGREAFGAPTRVAFAQDTGWLYVTDSSRDRIVTLLIPRLLPNLVPPRPRAPLPGRKGG